MLKALKPYWGWDGRANTAIHQMWHPKAILRPYGLVTELLRETYKGGLTLCILVAYVPGNLKACSAFIN